MNSPSGRKEKIAIPMEAYTKLSRNNKNPTLYHFDCGKIYEVNTTQYHSALNFGEEDRWHIIGIKYEDSNYWT